MLMRPKQFLDEATIQSGSAYQGSKARPYRWIGGTNNYGVHCLSVDRVWGACGHWTRLERIAMVQYIRV